MAYFYNKNAGINYQSAIRDNKLAHFNIHYGRFAISTIFYRYKHMVI